MNSVNFFLSKTCNPWVCVGVNVPWNKSFPCTFDHALVLIIVRDALFEAMHFTKIHRRRRPPPPTTATLDQCAHVSSSLRKKNDKILCPPFYFPTTCHHHYHQHHAVDNSSWQSWLWRRADGSTIQRFVHTQVGLKRMPRKTGHERIWRVVMCRLTMSSRMQADFTIAAIVTASRMGVICTPAL
jgi:hypothetical protein